MSKKPTAKKIEELEQKILYYERLLAETKQSQIVASENEQKYRALFENANDAILILDKDHFVSCNPMAETMFGLPKKEIIGKSPAELSPPTQPRGEDSHSHALQYIGAALAGQPEFFEWRFLRADQTSFDCEVSLNRLEIHGRPFIQAIIRDISARRRAEEELREKNLQYESLFHNSLVGIWRMEFEEPIPISLSPPEIGKKIFYSGYISDCNDAFAQMYATPTRQAFIGKRLQDFSASPEQSIQQLTKMAHNNFKMELLDSIEQDIKGNTRSFRNSFFGYVKDQHLIWLWGFQLDITEQKMLEKQFLQSQKMEAIGMLAGGIAHDFNNLLTVINGYSDLMANKLNVEDPVYKYVSAIKKAGQRAANLTSQLLAFSRKQILQPKVILINEIIEKMIQMIDRLIGDDIEVRMRLAKDLGQVKVDPVKVEQIIMNLVINARDAMRDGGELVIATANAVIDKAFTQTHPGSRTGKYVSLEVSDNGSGMEKKVLERIFEPFYTTKDKAINSGLGLATVYGIVKQSNGYIDVVSHSGKGSTFTIYFPRVDDVIDIDVDVPASKYGKELHGNETLLIVEDAENVRQVIKESLELYGYKIKEAGDGEEALQVSTLTDTPIHLVLTDVVMPKMDGFTFIKKLMPIHPDTKVLFMSGYTNETIVQKGELAPGVQFIQKPFNLIELARRIRRQLDEGS